MHKDHSKRTPTLTECGYPNSDLPSWYAVWAPKGTPADIIEKLHAKITEITNSDAMKAKLRQVSATPRTSTIAELVQFLDNDMKNNEELIKNANIKLE